MVMKQCPGIWRIRPTLTATICVALIWGSTASNGQGQATGATAGDPKGPTSTSVDPTLKPFVGQFLGERFKLFSEPNQQGVKGKLFDRDRQYDFVGTVKGNSLRGAFKVNGLESVFTAIVIGDTMKLKLGAHEVRLTRAAQQGAPDVKSVDSDGLRVTNTLLVESADMIEGTAVVSHDNRHVAFVENDGIHQRVNVNGVRSKPGWAVRKLTISETGGTAGFFVRDRDRKWQVGAGRFLSSRYDRIASPQVILSRDGKRFGCVAIRNEQYFVIIDGKEYGPYESAGAVVFTEKGERVAYVAKSKGKWQAWIDGAAEGAYDGIGPIVFGPDSKRYAYSYLTGSQHRVMLDGKPGAAHQGVAWIRFSPDSKRVATAVARDFQIRVDVNGKQGQAFDQVSHFTFSPNSQRFAYRAVLNGRRYAVIDHEPGTPHDEVDLPIFSADSKLFAYRAGEEGSIYVTWNGQKTRAYDSAFALKYSPVRHRFAFVARQVKRWAVLINDKPVGIHEAVHRSGVTFSPNDAHYVYGILRDKKRLIVVDEKQVVVPGKFARGARFVFDSPSTFYTVVQDGKAFRRLDIAIRQ